VQDVLVEGNAKGVKRRTTIGFYAPRSGQWRIVWIPLSSGAVVMLRGGADGNRIVLTGQDVDGSRLRGSFNDIRDNTFFWRGETSADGGKSQRTAQEMGLKRRNESSIGRKSQET
jgi:hypothetical protein